MIRKIHCDSRLVKQKDLLCKAGKKAALAAKKAEDILEKMIDGMAPREISGLTRHGEYRIQNCMKFDLGSGYRLITSKWEDQFYVLFIGTHDECHRWLENNRGWEPGYAKNGFESRAVTKAKPGRRIVRSADLDMEEPEDFIGRIDEKDLRIIFRGICEG